MSQADELINGLSDEEFALYTANPTEEQHIIVDENRIITVPSELKKIAVQYDHNIETVTFDCIRYWDGHDMSTMKVYINYTRSDKYTGCYLADNVRVDEADNSIMHFDWTISRNVTESVGTLTILVCIKMVDADGNEVNHWNSERNTDMTISQGMECGDIIVNKYPDVITYLLNMRFPVNYLESLDSANMVNLRDLDSGTYILKGKFRPFEGSTHIYTFSSGMLLSIIKQATTSYVQIFYSKDNTIQYLEIGDSSVTRKDAKLINMESIANKVTDINEGSDDYHYPSAKAVYNAITTTSITTSTATNLTGLLKGNGTSIEAAEANVDYQSPLIAGVDYVSQEQVNYIQDQIYSINDQFENKANRPVPITDLPTSGTALTNNSVYTVSAAVNTYAFKPPSSDGWAHGTFATGTAPNITGTGKIIGKLPDFAASKKYEFDVYNGAWIIQEVVTQ